MRSTLDQQSVDSWTSVDRLMHESKISLLLTKMSMECRLSVKRGVDRVLIKGINRRLTADAIHMIQIKQLHCITWMPWFCKPLSSEY